MVVNYCDCCNNPIKGDGFIITLSPNKQIKMEQVMVFNSCSNCIKLLEKVFSGKRAETEALLKELEKTYKITKKK